MSARQDLTLASAPVATKADGVGIETLVDIDATTAAPDPGADASTRERVEHHISIGKGDHFHAAAVCRIKWLEQEMRLLQTAYDRTANAWAADRVRYEAEQDASYERERAANLKLHEALQR